MTIVESYRMMDTSNGFLLVQIASFIFENGLEVFTVSILYRNTSKSQIAANMAVFD